MIHKVLCVVLAAGRSKRFLSGNTKLVHSVFGRPMVINSLLLARALSLPVVFVLGHERELVKQTILQQAGLGDKVEFTYQEEQLGTAHALECSKDFWKGYEHIFVINGDMPCIKPTTVKEFCLDYLASGCSLGFAASVFENSHGYGRVVSVDNCYKIVEQKDASEEELKVKIINAGIYIFNKMFLEENIGKINNKNKSGEFYLPDLINLAAKLQIPVFCSKIDHKEATGVNTIQELESIENLI